MLVAGWPAVAFAVAFELLLQQRRAERPGNVAADAVARSAPPSDRLATPVPATPDRAPSSPLTLPATPLSLKPVEPAQAPVTPPAQASNPVVGVSSGRVSPSPDTPTGDDALAARVRALIAENNGRPPAAQL